ncbi:hypothetical protein J2Y55_006048 [Bosea sp. BE125]|uniref:hypothetical protein n=1 Tax=Bosea sp. BE125 TaxID=2817909 RepID=UPI0028645103|nr:hypothetical protein [Bosea sp. BE125]MDR6875007.1 hypothetical protein [Bosea sp. BE125]
MSNVVSFDAFDSVQQIGAHQMGLPRIVLEGQDDVKFFENWFRDMAHTVVFVEASEIGAGGGCTSVPTAVVHSRQTDNIPAIGIVDRDTLFRKKSWSLLFTHDEDAFRAVHSDEVFTASLWEVEAYLLRPDLLPDWVAIRSHTLPAPAALCEGALQAAVEECEALLDAAPAFAAAHAHRVRAEEGWGANLSHAELGSQCAHWFAEAVGGQGGVVAAVTALVVTVRANAPADLAQKLVYYLRYVDTKRLLMRLNSRLGMKGNAHWALKTLMARDGYKPQELLAVVSAHADAYGP